MLEMANERRDDERADQQTDPICGKDAEKSMPQETTDRRNVKCAPCNQKVDNAENRWRCSWDQTLGRVLRDATMESGAQRAPDVISNNCAEINDVLACDQATPRRGCRPTTFRMIILCSAQLTLSVGSRS
jgi:hypothetical protein